MSPHSSTVERHLPTLGGVVVAAGRTLGRFPLVLLAGTAAFVSASLVIEDLGPEALRDRLMVVATLGLSLFTALTLAAERRLSPPGRHLAAGAIGIALLAVLYLGWSGWSEPVRVARYIQASAAFHLLVAFLPFAGRDEPNAFWQHNRILFERFLLATLYSGVLFAGLALALGALDQLFGVDVPGEGYGKLAFLIAFVVHPWLLLAGIPPDLSALEGRRDYPAGIKVFAQYVLVPLVALYLVILTLYLAKVLVTWDWPSGWVGYLVSGVAVAGMLSLLLAHPAAESEAHRWIATYRRAFYLAILPPIGMLWLAVGQRVAQYGVTERRYFVVLLSVWLAGIAVFYLVTRSRGLRVIPASLCVVAVATFGGPWGPYQVSEASQLRRLETILARNGMLSAGTVRPPAGEVSFEDRRELSAILRYLLSTHGAAPLEPAFAEVLASTDTVRHPERRAEAVAVALSLEYVQAWQRTEEDVRLPSSVSAAVEPAVSVAGYDYLVRVTARRADTVHADTGLAGHFDRARQAILITDRGQLVVEIPLSPVLERVLAEWRATRREPSPAALRAVVAGPGGEAVAYIRSFDWSGPDAAPRIRAVAADVLLKLTR